MNTETETETYIRITIERAREGHQASGIEAINLLTTHLCSTTMNADLRAYFVEALDLIVKGAAAKGVNPLLDPKHLLNIKKPAHRPRAAVKHWELASAAHFHALGRHDPEMSVTMKTQLTADWCEKIYQRKIDEPTFNKIRKRFSFLEGEDDELLANCQIPPP